MARVCSGDLIVGVAVICNTGQQAAHYMRLRADGAALLPAAVAVNEEGHEPHACGMAAIAFRRDKTMDTQSINGRLVSIVRISVIAGYDGERWSPAPVMVQYTVMEEERVRGLSPGTMVGKGPDRSLGGPGAHLPHCGIDG